ncbi:MAG: molybdopterin oxidoreductase [Caldilinea sp.]|jgi:anaerobic selenocysteine-containing dehydrogenase|nr:MULTISPECIES: molybdopterin-dependent oxidoreductase [Caldilinea]GIV75234.1 MAG: molybdopterin oxidoreductase [Caldilinea sp.]
MSNEMFTPRAEVQETTSNNHEGWMLSRRTFIKTSALLGGAAAVASQLPISAGALQKAAQAAEAAQTGNADAYPLADPNNILYTCCLQCNTGCPIKVKIVDGVISKIDGNPYAPSTFWPYLDYTTAPKEVGGIDGWICPKGQAGIQTAYDPYRLRKVLKRAGPRGSGKWESISFEQAIEEIVNGGKFADGTTSPGLNEIYALRDAKIAKEMAKAVDAILAEKDKEKQKALVEEFKRTFATHLDALIDPDHPDLGPKNNQFAFVWGRLKDGRGEIIKRFTGDAFGSVNAHGHTTVCQGSLYFTGKAMSEQFVEGKWTGGEKFYWQGDLANTEFAILVGNNVFEGGYGPPYRVSKITDGLVNGRLRYVVIDPRLGKTGSKAWKWLPNKPGTEGAIALALIQIIIANERYNKQYLENANWAAALADGEPNFCNAAWLVKLDEEGKPGKLMRGSDLGLEPEEREKADGSGKWKFDPFVVWRDGEFIPFDPNDKQNPVEGDLKADTEFTVTGKDGKTSKVRVKSALMVLFDSANEHTVEEWAEIAGVRPRDLYEIAQEFTSHGRKACADVHRGVSQHTNGYYNVQAWNDLNLLIGNYDYAGGLSVAKAYDQNGAKEGQPYPIAKMISGAMGKFGHTIIRSSKYETSTIFDGYPAKRPWYPLATDIYQEIFPSIGDAYPYPVKAVFLYMGSPVYALPAGHTNIEVLKDPAKLPLFVCFDIVIGETSMYADYIIPDLSYLERWEFHKSHPNVIVKNAPVRQPVIAPLTETVKVFGIEQPLCLESFLLAIAEKMNLPGFGPNGFGEGKPFMRMEDLYIKQVANIAYGEKPDLADAVEEASDEEIELFLNARRHLPKTVFDVEAWKAAIDNDESLWRRVVTVLNRGGRFQPFNKILSGDQLANKYGKYISLYCEKTYDTKDSMTGEHFSGVARYIAPGQDSLGNPVSEQDQAEGYDLHLITFRTITQTKSRTPGNYWLRAVEPTNYVVVNSQDAARMGLKTGDRVRITSKTNPEGVWDLGNGEKVPMEGQVQVIEGLRPGVVGFNLGYGHWAYGARDIEIDGQLIKGDKRRATGIHANAAMRTDTYNPNTTLSDLVGGSAVFYDTMVKLVKV